MVVRHLKQIGKVKRLGKWMSHKLTPKKKLSPRGCGGGGLVAKSCPTDCDSMDYTLPGSSDLSATDYHFFKHFDNFLQRKSFHNQQETENAFQEFIESTSTDFCATRINKLNFHWQKCVDCNCFCFD